MSLMRALKHRNFALLFSGQTLSRLGDFVFNIALAWWVLEKTGSALAMSAVMVFGALPMLIFVLLGGVAVDRLNRAWLLFLSDIGRGVIMLLATWLVSSNRLEIWMVYVGSLVFSFADAFFMPAYTALVPQLTPQDDWPSANSLSSLGIQLSRVVGPALGGLLVSQGGTALAFGINTASFFVSGLLLLPLLSVKPGVASAGSETDQPASSMLADIREGWKIVFSLPVLWVTILMAAFTNIFLAGPFSVGLPFLVKDFMGGDEKTLGLILGIFPIGYIGASLVLGNFKRLRRRGPLLFISIMLAGLGLGLFGLRVPFWLLAAAAILNGAALETFGQIWTNLMQELVPIEKLGRVSSIDMLGSFVLLPIGFGLTGLSIESIGPAPTFILGGVLTIICGALPLLMARIRRVD
jgi:DHA3 family tetracycline resistance protein-like MFS transporter